MGSGAPSPTEDRNAPAERPQPPASRLGELARRVLVCLATAAAVAVVVFVLRGPLHPWLLRPVRRACEATGGKARLANVVDPGSPSGMLRTWAWLSLTAALVVAFPLAAWQAKGFLAAGQRRVDGKAVVGVLVLGASLCVVGALFAYFGVLELAIRSRLEQALAFAPQAGLGGLEPLWPVSAVIRYEARMMLAFGLACEMPLVAVVLFLHR